MFHQGSSFYSPAVGCQDSAVLQADSRRGYSYFFAQNIWRFSGESIPSIYYCGINSWDILARFLRHLTSENRAFIKAIQVRAPLFLGSGAQKSYGSLYNSFPEYPFDNDDYSVDVTPQVFLLEFMRQECDTRTIDFILPSGVVEGLDEDNADSWFETDPTASPLSMLHRHNFLHFFPQSARIRAVIELGATLVGWKFDSISAIQDQDLDVVLEAGSTYQESPEITTEIVVQECYKAHKSAFDFLDALYLLDTPETIPMKSHR